MWDCDCLLVEKIYHWIFFVVLCCFHVFTQDMMNMNINKNEYKEDTSSMVLSYDFSHNICIGLFHDKMCCNCINLFPYIFVGFICIEFSIKGWRFNQDN